MNTTTSSLPTPKGVQAIPVAAPTKEEVVMYNVIDKTAVDGPRIHDFVSPTGKIVKAEFKPGLPTPLPMIYAKRLIGNDAFIVLNDGGNELRLIKKDGDGDSNPIVLAFDETIAKYEELTVDALIQRAAIFGQKFTKTTGRDKIISFLIEASGQIDSESVDIEDDEETLDI